MARTLEGYTETFCTMYGQKTIYIVLDDNQEKSNTNCPECSVCIIQSKLTGLPGPYALLTNVQYVLDSRGEIKPNYLAPAPPIFPHFLSRAPPL